MSDERQKDSDAENLERPLAADDQRPQRRGTQPAPVSRDETDHDDGESEEVQHPVRREVGLVVRDEPFEYTGGQDTRRPETVCQRHDKRKKNESDACGKNGPGPRQYLHARATTQGRPSAQCEQKLPGERIEVPAAGRIRREVPAEEACREVDRGRGCHRRMRPPHHDDQQRREAGHQDDVERKDIQVQRLELQHQALRKRGGRLLDEAGDIEFVEKVRVSVALRHVADRRGVEDEQQDVGDV